MCSDQKIYCLTKGEPIQRALRFDAAVADGLGVLVDGGLIVLIDAQPFFIHVAEPGLGVGELLVGGFAVPGECLGVILVDAVAEKCMSPKFFCALAKP